MSSTTIIALVSVLIILSNISSLEAQTFRENIVKAHNNARAQVGVGPVTWDDKVAAYALNYANGRTGGNCDLIHSGGPYGENLAKGGGDFTSTLAVNLWVGEKQFYDYNTNTCAPQQVCGHYTQVVWRNSVRIGCARVKCNNGEWFIICNYSPPGNYAGQKPY